MTPAADGAGPPVAMTRAATGYRAGADAQEAAARAGVTVTTVTGVPALRAVAELFALVWAAPEVPPMPHDLMRSLVHAGGAVHAAFRDGELAGAAVATFGPPASASCYSLIAGVAPGAQGRGTGLALKLAQRAWALQAGATRMTWTFDPLLWRNARFNLTRLGAAVTQYLTDFYGEICDGVNDPETDRLAVTWELRAPLPSGGGAGQAGHAAAPALLAASPAGEPVPCPGPAAGGPAPARVRCWIPADIMAVRRADPGLARQWRLAVRETLGGALARGYRVTGLAEPGWYLLARQPGPPAGPPAPGYPPAPEDSQ